MCEVQSGACGVRSAKFKIVGGIAVLNSFMPIPALRTTHVGP